MLKVLTLYLCFRNVRISVRLILSVVKFGITVDFRVHSSGFKPWSRQVLLELGVHSVGGYLCFLPSPLSLPLLTFSICCSVCHEDNGQEGSAAGPVVQQRPSRDCDAETTDQPLLCPALENVVASLKSTCTLRGVVKLRRVCL